MNDPYRYAAPRTPGRIFLAVAHFFFAFCSSAGLLFLLLQLPNEMGVTEDLFGFLLGIAFLGLALGASLTLGMAMVRFTPRARTVGRIGSVLLAVPATLVTIGTTILTVLVASEGGMGAEIALALSPVTVLLPLGVTVLNWFGFVYLGRRHVVEAFAWDAYR